MSTTLEKLRAIVDREVERLEGRSTAGGLDEIDLKALVALARVAKMAAAKEAKPGDKGPLTDEEVSAMVAAARKAGFKSEDTP